jgi:hypothetical protein
MNAENEFNCLIKCPCHLLNLIATTAISKITNVTFNKLKKNKLKENCRTFGISDLEVPWPLIPSKKN